MTDLFSRPLIVSEAVASSTIPTSRRKFLESYRKQLDLARREKIGNFDRPPGFRVLYGRSPEGRYHLNLRYNSRPLRIDGKDALDCGTDLASVIAAIEEVIAVAETGKLDPYINQVAAKIGSTGRRPKRTPTP